MSVKSIIIIIVLALGCAILVFSYGKSSTYTCFSEAVKNPDRQFHVVGVLDKEKGTEYDAIKNPNLFIFYLTDSCGGNMRVEYHKAKPQDFDRSDKIVIVGQAKDDYFMADDILLKCPSKYNDAKIDK